jgi:hypothetical protein
MSRVNEFACGQSPHAFSRDDRMIISKASSYFLERAGITPTRRGPIPKLSITLHPAHFLSLTAPYPLPYLLQDTNGNPPPDRVQSEVWPHG